MTVLTRAAKDELGRDREVFESVAISVHPEKDEFKFQVSRLLMEKGKKISGNKRIQGIWLATMNHPVSRGTTSQPQAKATETSIQGASTTAQYMKSS